MVEPKPGRDRVFASRVGLSGRATCFLLVALAIGGILSMGRYHRRPTTVVPPEIADCNFADEGKCDLHGRQMVRNKVLMELMETSEDFKNPEAHQTAYAAAEPFPHIVFDDLFSRKVLKDIAPDSGLGEFPESFAQEIWDASRGSQVMTPQEVCKLAMSRARPRGADGWRCINKSGTGMLKLSNSAETSMGTNLQGLIAALKSAPWISFLEELTGVSPLFADPTNFGSGMHQIMRGGSLGIHADFRRHPHTRLERRVNMFIYLNDRWEEEYGGHLELWNRNMTKCESRIGVDFGRVVIFSTSDFSYHGHADPLMAPPDRTRRSIAMYYYSPGIRPDGTVDESAAPTHGTLYQSRRCESCSEKICRTENAQPGP